MLWPASSLHLLTDPWLTVLWLITLQGSECICFSTIEEVHDSWESWDCETLKIISFSFACLLKHYVACSLPPVAGDQLLKHSSHSAKDWWAPASWRGTGHVWQPLTWRAPSPISRCGWLAGASGMAASVSPTATCDWALGWVNTLAEEAWTSMLIRLGFVMCEMAERIVLFLMF